MGNLMPLPVSSRSRSVVLRGRRERAREAGRHDHSCCCCCLSRKPHSKHTGPLWRRAPVRTLRTPRFVWGFFPLFVWGFFSSFERNLTPPKIKDKPSSFRNRECALSLRLNTPIRSVTFRSAQSLPRWVLRLLGWVRKYGKAPVGGEKVI